jgi:hypothetical protein
MSDSHKPQIAAMLMRKRGETVVNDYISECAAVFFEIYLAPAGISKAQMTAVGFHLRRADTLQTAESNCRSFLVHQMDKLKKGEEDDAAAKSWRKKVGRQKRPLGEVIVEWFDRKLYLPVGKSCPRPSIDQLQRFWYQVATLYRFYSLTGNPADTIKEIRR